VSSLDPIDESLSFLETRTLARFKRAHVLQTLDGTRLDLDFNVSAATDADLIAAMRDAAEKLSPLDTLPATNRVFWLRFVNVGADSRYRRVFHSPGLPGMRRPVLSFVVRIEHA
jgi:hypothetical protein